VHPHALSEKNSDGQTPLHLAATSRNLEIVQFLAEKHPNALSEKDILGYTPLHLAASFGKWNNVQSFVEILKTHPDQLSLKDGRGKTVLEYAREKKQTELLKYLESIGVKE
jgi:ankyrin repeat protein